MNQNFFAELVMRLFSSNPKFFKIVQLIALVLGVLSAALNYLKSSGAVLPGWVDWVTGTVVWVSSIVAIILAQLPNQDPKQTS